MEEPNTTLPLQSSPKETPGESLSTKRKLLEAGSQITQSFDPINNIKLHLCGFAFYTDDPSRQLELHHYCHSLNEDFVQCIVYDGPGPDARMIGIEYVISKKLFETLPMEEQRLWHSHGYDVKSGSFIAPKIPAIAEKQLMKDLVSTYGKTWILWQVDKGDKLPLGIPHLLQVATKDGEWNPKLFKERESRTGISTEKTISNLNDLELPPPHPNADGWKKKKLELKLSEEGQSG